MNKVVFDVIKPMITRQLQHLEIGPCPTSFDKILGICKDQNAKPTIRVQYDHFEVVGMLNAFTVIILDISKPPTELLSSHLSGNTFLGLRFDAGIIPPKWVVFLLQFKELKHLELDCKVDILNRIIESQGVVRNVFTKLTDLTLIIGKENMPNDNMLDAFSKTLTNFVTQFKIVVDIYLKGTKLVNFGPNCKFVFTSLMGKEPMYSCRQ